MKEKITTKEQKHQRISKNNAPSLGQLPHQIKFLIIIIHNTEMAHHLFKLMRKYIRG